MPLCRRHNRRAGGIDRGAAVDLLAGRVWPGSLAVFAGWVAVVSPFIPHVPVPVVGRVVFTAAAVCQAVDAVTARTRLTTLAVTGAALWGRTVGLLVGGIPGIEGHRAAAAEITAAAGWATLLLAATIIHLIAAPHLNRPDRP